MGIESRDWYRDAPKQRSSRALWVVGAAIVLVALFAASPRGRRALGLRPARPAATTLSVLPGTIGVTVRSSSLHPADDPWQRYIADDQTCPGSDRTDLPLDQQAQIMACLIDWAREQDGLNALPQTALFASTALQKADEILRCDNFAHAACGGNPAADVWAAGYRGAFGENLYIAGGSEGSPRAALDGWLNSPEHRENLFRAEWRTQGIGVVKRAHFGQYDDMTLWVSHFGSV